MAASCITHAVNTQMYAQHRRPLSLLPADKLASKETNRRVFFFCMPICSAAPNQPSGTFPKPPELSKGLAA